MVTHQLQVEHRIGKVCRSRTDVLPLCHVRYQDGIYLSTVTGLNIE